MDTFISTHVQYAGGYIVSVKTTLGKLIVWSIRLDRNETHT